MLHGSRGNTTIATSVSHFFKSLIFVSIVCIASTASEKTLRISGRIVAHNTPLACLNGNAYWSLIIRVHEPDDVGSDFVLVNFSQPCGTSPKWLDFQSTFKKFRLIRDKDRDEVLTEFWKCQEEAREKLPAKSCNTLPIWKKIPGAEEDKLPFGKLLPSYRSADLPLVPAV